MNRKSFLLFIVTAWLSVTAQEYQVKVSEQNEPMATGKYAPTWESLAQYEVPD